jgi:hypothetical protein
VKVIASSIGSRLEEYLGLSAGPWPPVIPKSSPSTRGVRAGRPAARYLAAELVGVLLAGVHPPKLVVAGPEAAMPGHRLPGVIRVADALELHHAEAAAGLGGEGVGVVVAHDRQSP